MTRLRGHPLRIVAAVVIGGLVGYALFQAVASVIAFNAIASEDFDPAAAEEALAATTTTTTTPPTTTATVGSRGLGLLGSSSAVPRPNPLEESREIRRAVEEAMAEREEAYSIPEAVSPVLPDEMFTSVLLIGSDASGYLADVMMLLLFPSDGSAPIMASIPRDLYVENPCKGRYTRVNANLGGCPGEASGSEQLALAVGRYTGIEVDHFARVGFEGFATVIDRMGGVTVCAGDTPLRDVKAHLELEAGCHVVDGETALGWVRSRQPERLIEGEWVPVGGSDFTRQRHQRQVLFQLARRLASASSVASLASTLGNLADAVRMDDGWTLTQVAELGWRYRNLDPDDVRLVQVGLADRITPQGAWVLIPTETFNAALARVYPPAAR